MFSDISELKNQIQNPISDEGFELIKQEVEDQIDSGYLVDQIDLVNYISQVLVDNGPELTSKNPKLYDEFQKCWALLAFAAFPGFAPSDQSNLLQKRLLYAIQKGFDPDDLLREIFSLYESYDYIKEILAVYAHDLESNTEGFGTLPVEVEGKRYLPQVKYWVLDYSRFPSKVAHRGTVERLNYIDQSQNTKPLAQGQRQILLKLLKFYDDLIYANMPNVKKGNSTETQQAQPPQDQVTRHEDGTIEIKAKTSAYSPMDLESEKIEHKLEDLKQRAEK